MGDGVHATASEEGASVHQSVSGTGGSCNAVPPEDIADDTL